MTEGLITTGQRIIWILILFRAHLLDRSKDWFEVWCYCVQLINIASDRGEIKKMKDISSRENNYFSLIARRAKSFSDHHLFYLAADAIEDEESKELAMRYMRMKAKSEWDRGLLKVITSFERGNMS